MEKEYRIIEDIGRFWELRWVVQEKYSYCDENCNLVTSWHTVYVDTDKSRCEKVMENYKNQKWERPSVHIEW